MKAMKTACILHISIYTLSDHGDLSNLIGSPSFNNIHLLASG